MELPELVQQFRVRYRNALLARAGILAALAMGLLVIGSWRLHAAGFPLRYATGTPLAAALLVLGGLGWWLRQRWISTQGAAAHLDEALGLQQRLITAEECAHAQEPGALYPLLLEDAARHYATERLRLPRPVDHTAGVLLVALLLLLILPDLNHVQGGALRPATFPSPPPPPPEPSRLQPPPPEESAQQRSTGHQPSVSQQPSEAGQRQSAGNAQQQDEQRQPPAGGSQEEQKGQPAGEAARTTPGRTPPRHSSDGRESPGGKNIERADGEDPRHQPQAASATQAAGNTSAEQGRGGGGARRAADSHEGAPGEGSRGEGDRAQKRGQQSPSQGGRGARSHQASQSKAASSTGGQQAGQGERDGGQPASAGARAEGTRASPAGGGTLSAGEQQALKEEIQGLLKEVSGELKQLQERLASAPQDVRPQAGTGTDPSLYEAPMSLDPRAGGPTLPMQLQTDTVETQQARPGGGAGQPSGTVARGKPQRLEEDAQLSEEPLEEHPTERQTVPPDYREIVDRLHRSPSE